MKTKTCLLVLISTACLIGTMHSPARSQSVSLFARDFEMATIRGSDLPQFEGAPLDELHVMSFIDGVWIPVLFQIDEKDASGSYFSEDDIAGLDGNDEIVFMGFDRGDAAPGAGVWPDDDESKGFPRGVVTIIDTITEKAIGYVYVYRSSTLDKNTSNYMNYIANDQASAQDTIEGLTYRLGNGVNGLPNYLAIDKSVGGSGEDLADRFRIDFQITVDNPIPFQPDSKGRVTDESFRNAIVRNTVVGPVRVIKELVVDLEIALTGLPDQTLNDIVIPIEHTPYIMQLAGTFDLNSLPDLVRSVDLFSLVFSFSVNAIPMTLFNSFNPQGVSVDGQSGDLFDPSLVFIPQRLAFHATGTQGTVVNIFAVPDLGNIQTAIFADASSIVGGHGFELTQNIALAQYSAGTFSFARVLLPLGFTGVFLPPNQPNSLGEELAQNAQSPIGTIATSQDYEEGVIPVELVSFTASVKSTRVELVWVTASETNNFGFDVERRPGDIDSWNKVGFVEGNGTTTISQSYEFSDENVHPGSYQYRLKQIDTDGSFEYSPVIGVVVGLPETFTLHQNFPNPFNPSTEIRYELPAIAGQSSDARETTLKIYNLLGQEIRTLVSDFQPPGLYTVSWDGMDDLGRPATSGVYIYRVRFGDFSATRKMIMVK